MNRFLLPLVCAALLAPAARADRFHLGSAETAEKMTDGEADVIEGVLLEETETTYRIRIEGGEIELAKSRVYKVEKTGLTVEQVQDQESDAAERLAEANRERRDLLVASREARMERVREVRAMEASMRAEAQAAEAGFVPQILQPVDAGGYDPVLGIYRGPNLDFVVNDLVQSELGGYLRRAVQDDLRGARQSLRQQLRLR